MLIGLVFFHFIFLHEKGSTNPYFLSSNVNRGYTSLYPYFILKDFLGLFIFFILYFILIAYAPNYLGHSDNYIEANALVTPIHIVPEWYFLPFYAILRSVPNKFFGVSFMILSIFIFFFLPFIYERFNPFLKLGLIDVSDRPVLYISYYYYPKFLYLFFVVFLLLG